ncbi:MAG: hypothetical protein C5B49_13840 [Bdellovibrio sp.]|nr:MAG: hypothetical protein C5B49_13840 [Bdellovibrio sp.]
MTRSPRQDQTSEQWMDRNKVPWVVGLLIFGFIALAVSFWLEKRARRERDSMVRIGQVERNYGTVFLFRPGSDQKKKVTQLDFLSPLDSVQTDEQSEARIALENNAVVRILPESLVTFERVELNDGFQDVLVLQRGDIHVEDGGREGEFFVAKNGQRVPGTHYHETNLSKEPIEKPVSLEIRANETSQGLSDDEINNLVGTQRGNFMKCYTKLLQKEPEAKGDLSLNFTIETSGRVGSIEVSAPRLQDDEFRKCISSVLNRVQFRTFTGAAISTYFPLKFE